MAIAHAEKLISRAEKGERLKTQERRHCVAFIMATQADTTNVAMGELFKVSERQIRLDKVYVREERAKLIKEEDVGLVVADIAILLDRQVRDMETSKRACDKGNRTYLEHCKAIVDVQLRGVKALQDLGYYPKNLGNMTIDKFEYSAMVTEDVTRTARPVDMSFDVIEGEFEELRALPPGEQSDTERTAEPV
jgi:hypothetical protein